MDLVALLPFQKMLQLALEPLLIGPSEVTGQKRPAARQPDAHAACMHIWFGAGMTQDHLTGRLHREAELQSGFELREGLQPSKTVHSGVQQALHMLEYQDCCKICIG